MAVILNEDFSAAGAWVVDPDLAISGGTLNKTAASGGGLASATLSGLGLVLGTAYRVTFTLAGRTTGNISVDLGGTSGVSHNSNGTFTEIIVGDGTDLVTVNFTSASNTGANVDSLIIESITGPWYYTDFSSDTPASQPAGWTERFDVTNSDFTVITGGTFIGGQAVEWVSSTNSTYRLLSWDVLDTDSARADAEILARFQISADANDSCEFLCLRGSGSGASENGYFARLFPSLNTCAIIAVSGGSRSLISANAPITIAATTFYLARFRVNGTTISLKIWEDGTTEPSSWTVTASDSAVSGVGWIGLAGYQNLQDVIFDTVAVATGGNTAGFTPAIQASQAGAFVVAQAITPPIQVSQAGILTVYNFPAESIDVSQAGVFVTAGLTSNNLRVSQAGVMVVAKGRVEEPYVRAWTFSLDGHDYYVLRLGNTETLVYDTFAQQWYVWGSNDSLIWRAFTGANWPGGNALAAEYGSNVLVGDDGNGALYFLDPEGNVDDDAISGADVPRTYQREVTGQIPTRSFDAISCFGVLLGGSIGETNDTTLVSATLYTSDDRGHTYTDQGTVTISNAAYQARAEWWSLGCIFAPGRLFKVRDYGALRRIDYLEMVEEDEDDG